MPPCVGCAPPRRSVESGLRVATSLSAAVSLAALVAQALGWLDMRFFLVIFGTPSAVLLIALAVYARLLDADVFLHNLKLGLTAGLLATLVYDGVRITAMATNLFSYDAFYAIRVFGSWISHQPRGSAAAIVTGWLYHFWNGLTFGVLFTLTFGRPRTWVYGLVYGIVMEIIMLGLFPVFLDIKDPTGFVVISLIGHSAFGATLGALTERHGRRWIEESA